jgi:glutamate racemase
MKIGIFDSGVGGLTILHKALRELPGEDYLYYADIAHVPYGTKDKEEVRQYVFDAVSFLADKGVKAIVLACNTATSVAVADLRAKYDIPIIGMEPALKPAVVGKEDENKRVLVTATSLTLREEKMQRLIEKWDTNRTADLLSLGELVGFAEKEDYDSPALLEYLNGKFSRFDMSLYETLVLGCTHFIYFKGAIAKIIPDSIQIIDGNEGTVRQLQRELENAGALGGGSGDFEYYHSGVKVTDTAITEKYARMLERLDYIQ